jgi:hypothetical protein
MSINLGWTAAQYYDYWSLVWGNHQIFTTVRFYDLQHRYIEDVSGRFLDGQVNFDVGGDVSRTLDLTLLDPWRNLSISGRDILKGRLYMNVMIQVFYGIAPPDGSRWYHVPVFCGPITNVAGDGPTLALTAAGKDSLAYASVANPKTWPKGTPVTQIIQYILAQVLGENPGYYEIPNSGKRMQHEYSLGRDSVPWKALQQLYKMIGCDIFYDGNGVLRARNEAGSVVAGFQAGQILSAPKVTFDNGEFANSVWVEGGDPKGDKNHVRGFSTAPPNHPFSPWALGRNNVPRYYVKKVEDDSIKEQGDADVTAFEELVRAIQFGINCEWDGMPYPLLEEYDLYQLIYEDINSYFRFKSATLPLSHDSAMSMGFNRKVTKEIRRRKRKRRHKPKHHGPKHHNGGKGGKK